MPHHSPGNWIKTEARHAEVQARRCYVQRGRPLQAESDERLDALWVAGMRAWATAIHPRPLALDDAEAELSLRGRKPPEGQAAPELAAIIEGLGRSLEAMPGGKVRSMVAEAMAGARGAAH
ncbi:hypothetical protein [Methylobacterium flocculans]|uniref:hypothetical protein n=1 Tax=Methylobacterium flocculans TaxID=2984843 RepID=UPI0021F31A86|nr:hypothetical protein [Methylobacterium sp. FF17]